MKKLVGTLIVFAALTATVQAATVASRDRVAQLDQASGKVATAAEGTKGYPRATLELKRLRLNGLIDDLEKGRAVDPREIDRALEDADRTPY
jgi:hypothetical protein